MKKTIAWAVLIAFAQMMTGCMETGGINLHAYSLLDSKESFEAKVFPEVRILQKNKDAIKAKLTRYGGGVVTILPFPYWNVEEIQMPLDDMRGIALPEKGGGGEGRFLGFFSLGFLISGTLGGSSSKYDKDYTNAIISAAELGAVIGFAALLLGSGLDRSPKGTFLFDKLTTAERAIIILNVMGLDAPRP